jgi:hypothetical protein
LNDNAASDEADAKGMEKDLMIDVNSWNSMEQIDTMYSLCSVHEGYVAIDRFPHMIYVNKCNSMEQNEQIVPVVNYVLHSWYL